MEISTLKADVIEQTGRTVALRMLGTSTLSLSYQKVVQHEGLLDNTAIDDWGVSCDPAAFFYHPNHTKLTFLKSRERFAWSSISPEATMLNITCHFKELSEQIIKKNITKDFPHLQSIALRCKLENIKTKAHWWS